MKPYTLAIAALLAAAPVFAQTPSDESVQKLIIVSQQDNMIKSAATSMSQTMRQTFIPKMISDIPKHHLSPTQKQRLEDAAFALYEKSIRLHEQPEFRAKMTALSVAAYKKHFTQEEVDYMINYLDTPIGQRILGKQQRMMQEIMPAISQLIEKEGAEYSQKLIADFVAEAKAIVGETPKPVRKPAKKSQPRKAKP